MRPLSALLSSCVCLCAYGEAPKVDNDVVRIVEVVHAARTPVSPLRYETNRVLVSLDAGNLQSTAADGHTSRRHWKTGQVSWVPAGESPASENVGSAPMRMIEIELKKPAPAKPVVRNPAMDPIVIDPKHNVLLFENDQVRVFRSWREPGATEMMHEHTGAGRVAVLLTDLNATVKTGDGSTSPVKASSGDALWSGAVTHATTNLGSKKFDMIVVEVK